MADGGALPSSSGGLSRTVTATRAAEGATPVLPATLRLRGEQRRSQRVIRWAENVVDNEGMGKKSSKVCCIYHGPDDDHETSSEDSSSSSSSDSEGDSATKRELKGNSKRSSEHRDRELQADRKRTGSDKNSNHRAERTNSSAATRRRPSPNAYERQPKAKPRSGAKPTMTQQSG